MGQFIGKAEYHSSAKPFLNLSKPDLSILWTAFHDIVDGFALSLPEFQQICLELMDASNDSSRDWMVVCETFFKLIDTDKNGLIDAIEFFCCISIPSGLSDRDKLKFIYQCFDFEGIGSITMDEMEIASRSTIIGLKKITITDDNFPHLEAEDYEGLTIDAFRIEGIRDGERIGLEVLLNYCVDNPDTKRFIAHYETYGDESKNEIHELLHVGSYGEQHDDEKEGQPSWMKDSDCLIPSKFSNINLPKSAPKSQLKLEWIHGYSDEYYNNIRYSNSGEICYHAANLGILYNGKKRQQRYFSEHTSKISSFSIHPDGSKIATGEEGYKPNIFVWEVSSSVSLSAMNGFFISKVSFLEFNIDGTKLLSIGKGTNEEKHLVIYDWESSVRLFSSPLCQSKVVDLSFGHDDVFATCGINHIYFWAQTGTYYKKKKGLFGRFSVENQTCVVFMRDRFLSGSSNGNLNVWDGQNCVKRIKAHDGSIHVINLSPRAIITGGADSKIRLWTHSLQQGSILDVSTLTRLPGSVRSVCLSSEGGKILLGMSGGEIFEISSADGSAINNGAITVGHSGNEILDIAAHPMKEEFCTVGRDKSVRMWDITTKTNFKFLLVEDGSTESVAFSPDGQSIAVAIGEGEKNKQNGYFIILKETDFTVLRKVQIPGSTSVISEVKYSLDGEKFIASSKTGDFFIYDPFSEFRLILSGKPSVGLILSNIDFSEDCCWIQAQEDYSDIIFANIEGDKVTMETNFSLIRDISWSTRTCPMGWHSLAAWNGCRSRGKILTSDLNESENVLATGDTHGRIRIIRYPCASIASSRYYSGHSSSVSKVRFANSDLHLISTGLTDGCLFQWQHEENDSESDDDHYESEGENESLTDNYATKAVTELAKTKIILKNEHIEEISSYNEEEIKPENHLGIPSTTLDLSFIYGYNPSHNDTKFMYNSDGDIIYCQANVGIVYDIKNNKQRFHLDHREECLSLAISPCRRYVATGSNGNNPKVCVWDSFTTETKSIMEGIHNSAVLKLAFTLDGEYLISVEGRNSPTIAIQDWKKSFLKFKSTIGIKNFKDISCLQSVNCFKVFVLSSYSALILNMGSNVYQETIREGNRQRKQSFTSCVVFQDVYIVGTSKGDLFLYEGKKLGSRIKAHDGPINCLSLCTENRFISGGNDRKVKLWVVKNGMMECKTCFDLDHIITTSGLNTLQISALDASIDLSTILVGTADSKLFELSLKDDVVGSGYSVIDYHRGGFCHDMTSHSTKTFATIGDDGIRVWDFIGCKLSKFVPLDAKCTSICYSPDGHYLVVGTGVDNEFRHKKAGTLLLFHADTMTNCFEGREYGEAINTMNYSQDGKYLAVSYIDAKVILFEIKGRKFIKANEVKLPDRINVLRIDFSNNSDFIKVTGESNTSVYADTKHGKHVRPEFLESNNVNWPIQSSAYELNLKLLSLSISNKGDYLASYDKCGTISLSPLSLARSKQYKLDCHGHTAFLGDRALLKRVMLVTWSLDDKYIFSIGAQDKCIFQWQIHINEEDSMGTLTEGTLSSVDPEKKTLNEDCTNKRNNMLWENHALPPTLNHKDSQNLVLPKMYLDFILRHQTPHNGLPIVYNLQGDIVYSSSNLGIIFNACNMDQKYHKGQEGIITSSCLSLDRKTIATADKGILKSICLWDPLTGNNLSQIKSDVVVSYLAFSPDGTHLVSIGRNGNQEISIYRSYKMEWTNPIKVATKRWYGINIMFSLFIGDCNFPLMIADKKYIRILKKEGRTLKLLPRKYFSQSSLSCACLMKGIHGIAVITGTETGELQQRMKRNNNDISISKEVLAHDGTVTAVTSIRCGVISGGNDGKLCHWDSQLIKLQVYRLDRTSSLQSFSPFITSICCDIPFKKALLSLKGGEIIEISKDSGNIALISPTHGLGETCGIAMHPTNPMIYATSDKDGHVRVWNISKKRVLRKMKFDCECRAIAWSNDGQMICVGMGGQAEIGENKGGYVVLDSSSFRKVFEDRKNKKYIISIKYSPCGKNVAFSTSDGKICIHAIPSYKLKVTTTKQSAPISKFDFSHDGDQIQSQCNGDLMYFSTRDGSTIRPLEARDIRWNTYNCLYGWSVKGLWHHFSNGKNRKDCTLTSIDVSLQKGFGAYATSSGSIGIFTYPAPGEVMCIEEKCSKRNLITSVNLNCDGSYLISLQKEPNVILQYRVKAPVVKK